MKVNVKFANGNCLAFLGQGYITSDDKKVFVRLYATSDLTHIVVKMYHHHGYSFTWPKAKELGLVQQSEFRNGTIGVVYYCGIDDFLESYHNAVYNCLNI